MQISLHASKACRTMYGRDCSLICMISKTCSVRHIIQLCTCAGDAGIGSVVHHMGQALALAIETNRTLVVAPDVSYPYTDTQRCLPSFQDCMW